MFVSLRLIFIMYVFVLITVLLCVLAIVFKQYVIHYFTYGTIAKQWGYVTIDKGLAKILLF